MNTNMPLVNKLSEYIEKDFLQFHMPGHLKGKSFDSYFAKKMLSMDLTELPGLDDLHNPVGVLEDAQILAAEAFGADHTFFLVNGSTTGILAMIGAALKPKDKLILPRNCHRSVISAITLFNIVPIYIKNKYDFESDLILPISPEEVETALNNHPDAKGVLVINPDYFGLCPHLKDIEAIVHGRDKILFVDEAHGAHLRFNGNLPLSASEVNADAWVQSAHKTLSALTQAAMLHLNGDRIDVEKIKRVLSFLQTSSPSYMILASLDWARAFMSSFGESKLDLLIENLNIVTQSLNRRWDLKVVTEIQASEHISAKDPTRLLINLTARGLTGFEILRQLRENKVEPEMADLHRVVFICSVGHNKRMLGLLMGRLNRIIEASKDIKSIVTEQRYMFELPKQMITPTEVIHSMTESVSITNCIGRISASTVGAYPPGIPLYCPGELIDSNGAAFLAETLRSGGKLFGLNSDCSVSVIK